VVRELRRIEVEARLTVYRDRVTSQIQCIDVNAVVARRPVERRAGARIAAAHRGTRQAEKRAIGRAPIVERATRAVVGVFPKTVVMFALIDELLEDVGRRPVVVAELHLNDLRAREGPPYVRF